MAKKNKEYIEMGRNIKSTMSKRDWNTGLSSLYAHINKSNQDTYQIPLINI